MLAANNSQDVDNLPELMAIIEEQNVENEQSEFSGLLGGDVEKLGEKERKEFVEYTEELVRNRSVKMCLKEKEIMIPVVVLGNEVDVEIEMLLDTGAQRSFVSVETYSVHKYKIHS